MPFILLVIIILLYLKYCKKCNLFFKIIQFQTIEKLNQNYNIML